MNSPRMLNLKIWKIFRWVQIYISKIRSDVTAVFLCCLIFFTQQDQEGMQSRGDEEYEEKVSPRAIILLVYFFFTFSRHDFSTGLSMVERCS